MKKERNDQNALFHLRSLHASVMNVINLIFQDLDATELLKTCLHGGTQIPSESLNNDMAVLIEKEVCDVEHSSDWCACMPKFVLN